MYRFTDVQRANAEALYRLASKSIEAYEKLTALEVDTMRSMMTAAHRDAATALSEHKQDQSQRQEMASALPSPEKAEAYTRELFDIASDVQAELARWTQEQIGAQQETLRAWVDQVGRASTSVAHAAERFSGTVQQAVQQSAKQASETTERSAQETSATADAMSKAARRAEEQTSQAAGGSAAKH
jgi:hypothetical protein